MAKRYTFQARESKANSSVAYSNGSPVRVSLLQVNPTTHNFVTVKTHTFRAGKFETLTKGVIETFGVIHGQRDRLIYEIGR
jgi:hypothetical protein